jgi:hypothetical protein
MQIYAHNFHVTKYFAKKKDDHTYTADYNHSYA